MTTTPTITPTQADRDAAARVLGYANWDAIFNKPIVDSSGIRPIPSIGLKWSAEQGAKELARHRLSALAALTNPSEAKRLAGLMANMRQGKSETPRCEAPSEYEIKWCLERVNEVFAALSAVAAFIKDEQT